MFGIALALLSALCFGLSQIFVRKNLEKSNFVYISLTVTIMGNIILWPLALIFTDLNTVNPEGLMLFIIAGLLAPGIARLFYFKGMETAGISANASIFATYPLYTSIVAVSLLGEALIHRKLDRTRMRHSWRNIYWKKHKQRQHPNQVHTKKGLNCSRCRFLGYSIFADCKKGRLEHLQPATSWSCIGIHHNPNRLPSSTWHYPRPLEPQGFRVKTYTCSGSPESA